MIARKYIEALVIVLACLGAILLGSHIVTFSMPELGIVTFLAFTLIWAFVAGDYWWIPMLTGATITGVFKIGFKIYPVEIALALAIIGLLPLLLVQHHRTFQSQRKPLPFVFYLTALYLTIRFMIDIIPAHGARGNLGRIYFDAIWPFIFGWLFHHYGKLSSARWALGLLFVLLTLRCLSAVVGYLINVPLYIPGINYVLSFSDADSMISMRGVAFILLLVSLIYFHSSKSFLGKLSMLPYFAATTGLVVMSAGRFATLLTFLLPVAFFTWARNWILLFVFLGAAAGIVAVINVDPRIIGPLPPSAQRALSGLLIKQNAVEAQEATVGSDFWHSSLRTEAYNRWTKSLGYFVFGYGVVPSPDLYDTKQFSVDFQDIIAVSSNVASYESAFWTVVAVLGTTGFVLYTLLFIQLGRQVLPYFLQKPRGTVWEGFIFWGCSSTLIWFVTSNYQGEFPALELVTLIMAVDIVQDGKIPRRAATDREIHPAAIPPAHGTL